MPAPHEAAWRRRVPRGALGSILTLVLATAAARGALPPGWQLHVFAGRIWEIEPAGGVLACATDGGLLLYHPGERAWAQIADAGCVDRNCLTSNRLTGVSRGSDGRYWLATGTAGVVMYRPHADRPQEWARFFVLNTAPGGTLMSDSVTCIEAWRDQVVYVGTSGGVGQIDVTGDVLSYNSDAERRLGSDLLGTRVEDLAADSLWVWAATDSALSRYGRRPPYAVQRLENGLGHASCLAVETLAESTYVGTSTGVFVWMEGEQRWRRLVDIANPAGTPAFAARSLTRLASGQLVAGSDGWLWTYDGSNWSQGGPPGLGSVNARGPRVFFAVAARGDTLWANQSNHSGEGGFLEMWTQAGGWVHVRPTAPPVSEMRVVSLDPLGNAWVATRFGGVGRLATNGDWCVFNRDDPAVVANMSDPDGHALGLVADHLGGAWFAAVPLDNAARLDRVAADPGCDHRRDVWSHIDPCESSFSGRYWRMLVDGEGNRYFLSDAEGPSCPSPSVPSGGFDILSADGTRSTAVRADLLGGSRILALAFDAENGPWRYAYYGLPELGNQGLRRWFQTGQLFDPQPQNFDVLALPSAASVTEYRDIVVTRSAGATVLWVATDAGIFEYEVNGRGQLTSLGAKVDARPGLLSPDIKDLQLDDFGNLWIGTVKGLNRIRIADREPGGPVVVDAFTTIEVIRELNAGSSVGQLYDPRRALAPLPGPHVNSLAYDAARDLLFAATQSPGAGGLAVVDLQGLNRRAVIPLERAIVYPNPVRQDAGQNEVHLGRTSEPAQVAIYDLEGQLVCALDGVEDGDVIWDLGTGACLTAGQSVSVAASGLYFVHITTSAGSVVRPLVLLR